MNFLSCLCGREQRQEDRQMFGLVEQVSWLIESHNKREELINNLPDEIADKIREQDAQDAREILLHNRALEVAETGRAKNFWGK